jgi:hypothetical protein
MLECKNLCKVNQYENKEYIPVAYLSKLVTDKEYSGSIFV